MDYINSIDFAREMDRIDPLNSFQDQFHMPVINGKKALYFTGNSLGLQPKNAKKFIEEELNAWATLGVEGHFEGMRPWFHYHKFSKEILAEITGSKPLEVVAMNNLSSNLHLLLVSFYRPNQKKFKILMEEGAFPSDQYIVETQVRYHGYDPKEAVIEMAPRKGESLLHTSDILEAIHSNADSLALVMMSGVQYYTGQFFDIKTITETAHSCAIPIGFDLAHAIGNVPLQLHNHGVDFAAWCSYKYLNSGPGNTSGIFVHEKYANDPGIPRFGGWWGQEEASRFLMKNDFRPMEGADGWQLSNVNVLSTAAHLASLEIFKDAGLDNLRTKSIKLTGFFEFIIQSGFSTSIEIITPKDPSERGCQLSLVINNGMGKSVYNLLRQQGVVADWREPDVIRVAPVPLYNTFEDVFRFGEILSKSSINQNRQ